MPKGVHGHRAICSIEGCGGAVSGGGWGWCGKHYSRWKRHGDPLASVRLFWPDNLLSKMDPQPNGCTYWTGAPDAQGYGKVCRDGVQILAHRASYEYFVGPIPDGLGLDHTCHSADPSCTVWAECSHRVCVNPAHLEPVTHAENVRRGNRWR